MLDFAAKVEKSAYLYWGICVNEGFDYGWEYGFWFEWQIFRHVPCLDAFPYGFSDQRKNPSTQIANHLTFSKRFRFFFDRRTGIFFVFTPRNPTLVFRGVFVFYRQGIFPPCFLSFTGPFPGKQKGKNKNDGNMQEQRKETVGSDGNRRPASRSDGRCPCSRHKDYRRAPLRRYIRRGLPFQQ